MTPNSSSQTILSTPLIRRLQQEGNNTSNGEAQPNNTSSNSASSRGSILLLLILASAIRSAISSTLGRVFVGIILIIITLWSTRLNGAVACGVGSEDDVGTSNTGSIDTVDGNRTVADEGSAWGDQAEEVIGVFVGVGAGLEAAALGVLAGEITDFAGFWLFGIAGSGLSTLVRIQMGLGSSAVAISWDGLVVNVVLERTSLGLESLKVDLYGNTFSILAGGESEGSLDSILLVEDGLISNICWVVFDFGSVSEKAGLEVLSEDGWKSEKGESEKLHFDCCLFVCEREDANECCLTVKVEWNGIGRRKK